MNSKLLIDAIMRQTTILIAQLSTAAGIRAPLAHLADQVFLHLASEIEAQGVGRKVVADMFGLALRSYQKKVQRLTESATASERTLWEAVLDFLKERGSASRKEIYKRFYQDEERHVAAVLNDLVNSGLVLAHGRGNSAAFRMSSDAERKRFFDEAEADSLTAMLWLALSREPKTLAQLKAMVPVKGEAVEQAVKTLVHDGRVTLDYSARPPVLTTQTVVIPVGTEQGWEVAVFDHFRAVANAIASKVRGGTARSSQADVIGGATLSFDLYSGHPYEAEVYGLLTRVRSEINSLWNKVASYNRTHPAAGRERRKVVFYFGQNVEELEAEAIKSRDYK
ncbi:MAG: hypothetical protein JXA30_21845 [Deltaproteobacteria bacterium]|nr:hypothetical protein [Deltaproteobacteria bacterium]